jgi:hypothetical protein
MRAAEAFVIRRKVSLLFTSAGSFVLAAAIGLRHWMHGNYADFTSGFLFGVSIALLILGLARESRSMRRDGWNRPR